MQHIQADVVIVGAGGTGLRAAIAIAESDPDLKVALISKVYPMRSHTCAAEGGAAGVKRPDDSLALHFDETANRLNKAAIQSLAKVETHRVMKLLGED